MQAGEDLVELSVHVPVGVRSAAVHLPLLGRVATDVKVRMGNAKLNVIWDATLLSGVLPQGVTSCQATTDAAGGHTLEFQVLPGSYKWRVSAQ